jgi:hypothetical protein
MKMRPRAYISHQLPGRIRIRVPEAKRRPAFLENLRQLILSTPGVETVDCNSLTGSLLIHYSLRSGKGLPAFLSAPDRSTAPLLIDPPPQSSPPRQKGRRRAPQPKEPSEAAKAIMEFFADMDDFVRTATGNQLDLKVLLPLVVGSASLLLFPHTISTPLWITLMIFTFSSFLVLHEPGAAGEVVEIAEMATALET